MKSFVNPHFLQLSPLDLFGCIRTSKSKSLPGWQGIACQESQEQEGSPSSALFAARPFAGIYCTQLPPLAMRTSPACILGSKEGQSLPEGCVLFSPFSSTKTVSQSRFCQFLKSIFSG